MSVLPDSILKIRQVGERCLRSPARPVAPKDLSSAEIQALIEMMRETMRDAPGVGLAAPQVGVDLRIAVIEDRAEYQRDLTPDRLADRGREPVPFHVLINPTLTVTDPTPQRHFEGCLSVAGYTAVTPRAAAVQVNALNEKGESLEIRTGGWYARILQHEIDHLSGRLYLDTMLPSTFMTSANFQRYWAACPTEEVCRVLGAVPH
ncbi:MAG: peptide deformylase [Methylotetracoccus sp.]|jgi:peptide deformylase|nr:peptide deformylase [Methylotetracoccus sp.]